jgi:hypothetical protein
MRRFVLLCLALAALALPVRADEPGDSIRAVIVDQLNAFRANDLGAAFAHASPMIQSKFRTPEIFGQMVQAGYPMVWRPSRYEMEALTETPRGPVQTVLFEDQHGRLFEADYEMRQVDGEWRINGVTLRELPGLGS